jgi:hypothetical protein
VVSGSLITPANPVPNAVTGAPETAKSVEPLRFSTPPTPQFLSSEVVSARGWFVLSDSLGVLAPEVQLKSKKFARNGGCALRGASFFLPWVTL